MGDKHSARRSGITFRTAKMKGRAFLSIGAALPATSVPIEIASIKSPINSSDSSQIFACDHKAGKIIAKYWARPPVADTNLRAFFRHDKKAGATVE
jgi:hypothetical protein